MHAKFSDGNQRRLGFIKRLMVITLKHLFLPIEKLVGLESGSQVDTFMKVFSSK